MRFLSNESLYAFLTAVNNRLSGSLTLECINEKIEALFSESMSIISKDEVKFNHLGVTDKNKRVRQSEGVIHWGTFKLQLLPEEK